MSAVTLAAGSPVGAQEPAPEAASAAEAPSQLGPAEIERAIERLETARREGEADEIALAVLGGLYAATGQHSQAFEVLAPLADREAADPIVLYNAGRAALSIGELDRAARWLERSYDVKPDSTVRRELGLLRSRQGRDGEALELLLPWSREAPDDLQARAVAAVAALNLKRADEARWLTQGLPPERPATQLLRGRLALIEGHPAAAVSALESILEAAPRPMQRDVRRNLASAYLLLGRASSAIEVLRGYAEGDLGMTHQLAQAYYQDGRGDEAIAALRPLADELLGGSPLPLGGMVLLDLSRFLIGQGLSADALVYLDRLLDLSPRDPAVFQLRAQALAAVGRRLEAQAALDRYRELTKGTPP